VTVTAQTVLREATQHLGVFLLVMAAAAEEEEQVAAVLLPAEAAGALEAQGHVVLPVRLGQPLLLPAVPVAYLVALALLGMQSMEAVPEAQLLQEVLLECCRGAAQYLGVRVVVEGARLKWWAALFPEQLAVPLTLTPTVVAAQAETSQIAPQ
jgi:hypothetical protein